jgi:hypothetical protein
MRSMAGFGLEAGKFHLPRAKLEPPSSLAKQIFPWVEQWEKRVLLFKQKKSWDEGGLDQEDKALEGFLGLLKYLRAVLLQDIAVLQAGKCTLFFYPRLLLTIYVHSLPPQSPTLPEGLLGPRMGRFCGSCP